VVHITTTATVLISGFPFPAPVVNLTNFDDTQIYVTVYATSKLNAAVIAFGRT
jgi:hypothetical protein